MKRNFLHEVNTLFHIRGNKVQVSIPCFMTFQPPYCIAVKKAWFNPQTQKIEVEAIVADTPPREKGGAKNTEPLYI